jgi:hypothetical protein
MKVPTAFASARPGGVARSARQGVRARAEAAREGLHGATRAVSVA